MVTCREPCQELFPKIFVFGGDQKQLMRADQKAEVEKKKKRPDLVLLDETGGIALVTLFVHPSTVEILDAAVEDVIEHGNCFTSILWFQDAYKLLSLCPSVQSALKNNKALILWDSYVFRIIKHSF
ncbi:hypothetical protein L2E82_42750 [Cichorium intybus]|uniref:Uncharacterized protein n=1 Tax=Cichorium intybus TaxID=13427 RepID=A0ACB8ZMI7_CICIN|nr:hypothetical protein L2E82_42750 [Cichorium intybus]